jgi:hypothetical protein
MGFITYSTPEFPPRFHPRAPHSLCMTRAQRRPYNDILPWKEKAMAYSDFTLQEVTQRFQLVLDGVRGAACQSAHAVEPLENARLVDV